jgi:hypothetical protein
VRTQVKQQLKSACLQAAGPFSYLWIF